MQSDSDDNKEKESADDDDIEINDVSCTKQSLNAKTVAELKALCRKHELYRSGNKSTLIQRLLNPTDPKNKCKK